MDFLRSPADVRGEDSTGKAGMMQERMFQKVADRIVNLAHSVITIFALACPVSISRMASGSSSSE